MKVNYCGGSQQERMIANGWRMILAEFRESPEELYERLVKYGYEKVKVYWNSTRIKSLHSYFAFVK